jgi:hypothetical protein
LPVFGRWRSIFPCRSYQRILIAKIFARFILSLGPHALGFRQAVLIEQT